MTIRKYVIIAEDETKGITYEIPIDPQSLKSAFEYNTRAIWLYIDAYLAAKKEEK